MMNCSNRFVVILAAAAIALIAGAQGLRAQDQTGIVADADGIEPPDCGFAVDLDKAHRDYVERQRRLKDVATRSVGNK